MKFKALLLSSLMAVMVALSTSALTQDDKQKSQTPNSQTQSSSSQTATPNSDQTQAQPADQSQSTATDQDQAQPASTDQDKKDKKDKKKDKDAKGKHSGGKDDVDAIGNRKVAGWDWYSIESEIRMGKEYATQLESSLKLVTDPVI